eukprot:4176105-Lingulodinium_polyedra.AAC.1
MPHLAESMQRQSVAGVLPQPQCKRMGASTLRFRAALRWCNGIGRPRWFATPERPPRYFGWVLRGILLGGGAGQ